MGWWAPHRPGLSTVLHRALSLVSLCVPLTLEKQKPCWGPWMTELCFKVLPQVPQRILGSSLPNRREDERRGWLSSHPTGKLLKILSSLMNGDDLL